MEVSTICKIARNVLFAILNIESFGLLERKSNIKQAMFKENTIID
jgi:hypothetical protein